jgi:hypothetical protein
MKSCLYQTLLLLLVLARDAVKGAASNEILEPHRGEKLIMISC